MKNTTSLLDYLQALNRKERYYLVTTALSLPRFTLGDGFRQKLGALFGIEIPRDAFTALDYHLDWLYAALTLLHDPDIKIRPAKDRFLSASGEAIDFLVAFQAEETYHLIFLEVKGFTPFSNEQLRSKLVRLEVIFQDEGQKLPRVVPHFAIVSPREPARLDYKDWPVWAHPDGKVKWLELVIGHHLLQVGRCNSLGFEDKKGHYWQVQVDKNTV